MEVTSGCLREEEIDLKQLSFLGQLFVFMISAKLDCRLGKDLDFITCTSV